MKTNVARRRGHRWWRLIGISVAVLVMAAAGYLAWSPAVLSAGGMPKLVVDRTVIDFGEVSYGRFVTAQFRLSNAGDGTLTITEAPVVKALKGC